MFKELIKDEDKNIKYSLDTGLSIGLTCAITDLLNQTANNEIKFVLARIILAGIAQSVQRLARFRDRIPVEARVSGAVHTGPGTHRASYTMGTASFLAVRRRGGGLR